MPFVGGGYRDEFLSPDPKRQQVGIGGDGADGPEGEGALGALAVHPAERLCFSQPPLLPLPSPSDPSDGPELQGNYGNAALKPSKALFQFFPRDKAKAIRAFYEPSSIKCCFCLSMFPTFLLQAHKVL